MKNRLPVFLSVFALAALSGNAASAQTFNWVPTSGATQDWNLATNWDPNSAFPNSPGAVANVLTDLTQAQTIRLREPIVIGRLLLGDASADAGTPANFAFTIGNASGEAFFLTMDSGAANTSAIIGINSSGTPNNTIGVPVLLNSHLVVDLGSGTQRLVFSNAGSLDLGPFPATRNVTVTNGASGVNQLTFNGNLTGAGVFTNNSNASVILNGPKDFTGVFVLNRGVGGSNTGSLTVTAGSIANAAEVIINGALSGGTTQAGGILHAGDNSARDNPGQRLTQNRITLNSGTLNANGQTLNAASANTMVQDTVATLDLNSGFSFVVLGVGGNSLGTRLNVTTLERSPGASAYIRSSTLGGTAQLLAGNGANLLVGAGGAEATTTMSVIPWIGANNTAAGTGVPTGFATSTANGIRALDVATEYATSITAGSTANVNIGTIPALTGPTTVNALRLTFGTSNIGAGQELTITSGGLFFSGNNATLGGSGNANAGAVAFGSAEGVVWANGSNTNTIGAAIGGVGGLTKAGTGALILSGINAYDGLTYVGGGTLQVGDGFNSSNLGQTGDVTVANGATLSLFNNFAIADTATLKLEQFGLLNGRVNLELGVNETVGSLFFGDTLALAGTYGSTLSGATFQNDKFFSGTGMITVAVPEPGSALLLIGAISFALGLHRKRE
ncbi:MAG TPA: autotransporter-associated beta strand repeat-containing protein [Chthoniobacteraceae bacterium]|nr:autotransporter-associated beta strand repeat-containing protein [Chthoniobacteraceae bacterium]